MKGLAKGGQGPISGCCAIEEEEVEILAVAVVVVETVAVVVYIPVLL
jgi:hypothetical protein